MIVGPAIGGYAYAWMPPAAYIASAILLVFAFIGLSFIGPVPRSPVDRNRHPIQQIVDGAHYVWRNKLVLGAITPDLFAVLLAGRPRQGQQGGRPFPGPEGAGELPFRPHTPHPQTETP